MLTKELYQPNNLSTLYHSHLTTNKLGNYVYPTQEIMERQIILSLLYILQGLQKYPFSYKNGKGYEMCQKAQTMHLTQKCLHNGVEKIISCANILDEIRHKNEILGSSVNPQVKTFSQSIQNYVHRTNLYFTSILTQLQKESGTLQSSIKSTKPLTIISLEVKVEEKLPLLNIVLKILNNALTSTFNQVFLIINDITGLIDEFSNYQIKEIDEFYQIVLPIIKHQIIIIKDWLMLKDPAKQTDFFIRQSLKEEKVFDSDTFFHQPNPIYINSLPNIFQPSAKSILQVGKTIRYILLFFTENQKHSLMKFFDIQTIFKEIISLCTQKTLRIFPKIVKQFPTINSKLKALHQKKLTNIKVQKDNPYQMFPTVVNAFYFQNLNAHPSKKVVQQTIVQRKSYCNFNIELQKHIKQIIQKLNQRCFKLFKTGDNVPINDPQKMRRQITNTLRGIKQFMLYSQGDFFQELMVMIYDTMQRPMSMISSNLVSSYIEEAKKSSNAKQLGDKILQNVSFLYLSTPQKAQYLKGWHNFSIAYKPPYPTNYIFTSKIMECFGHIFNFIFQLKKCQFTIKNLWEQFKQNSTISVNTYIFRNSIHSAINTLMSHIMIQIDLEWTQFSQKIQDALSIIQIMEHTHKVIAKLRKLTIDEKYLVSTVQSLGDIVDRFKKSLNKGVIEQEIDKMRNQLRNIIQLIMKVQYYKQVLDFNQYYAQIQ